MATFYRLLGFLRPYRRGLTVSWGLASLAMVMTVALPGPHRARRRSDRSWCPCRRSPPDGAARARSPHAADAGARDPRRGAAALGGDVLAADGRRAALAGRRIRLARAGLRPSAAPGARLLRPPADRPVDVARHGGPAGRALLPRLRPRVHPAVDPHDRVGRRGDDRRQPRAGPDRARSSAVRGGHLLSLRPPRAACDPGGTAAHRRAHRRRRGEHHGGAGRQGVRPRAPPAASASNAAPGACSNRRWSPPAWKPPTTRSSASCLSSASPPCCWWGARR